MVSRSSLSTLQQTLMAWHPACQCQVLASSSSEKQTSCGLAPGIKFTVKSLKPGTLPVMVVRATHAIRNLPKQEIRPSLTQHFLFEGQGYEKTIETPVSEPYPRCTHAVRVVLVENWVPFLLLQNLFKSSKF